MIESGEEKFAKEENFNGDVRRSQKHGRVCAVNL